MTLPNVPYTGESLRRRQRLRQQDNDDDGEADARMEEGKEQTEEDRRKASSAAAAASAGPPPAAAAAATAATTAMQTAATCGIKRAHSATDDPPSRTPDPPSSEAQALAVRTLAAQRTVTSRALMSLLTTPPAHLRHSMAWKDALCRELLADRARPVAWIDPNVHEEETEGGGDGAAGDGDDENESHVVDIEWGSKGRGGGGGGRTLAMVLLSSDILFYAHPATWREHWSSAPAEGQPPPCTEQEVDDSWGHWEALLENYDPLSRDKQGNNTLNHFVERWKVRGDDRMVHWVERLLFRGMDVENVARHPRRDRQFDGLTPLLAVASIYEDRDCSLEWMLSRPGVDIHARTPKGGNTLFHLLMLQHRWHTALALLQWGNTRACPRDDLVDFTARNRFGRTVRELAAKHRAEVLPLRADANENDQRSHEYFVQIFDELIVALQQAEQRWRDRILITEDALHTLGLIPDLARLCSSYLSAQSREAATGEPIAAIATASATAASAATAAALRRDDDDVDENDFDGVPLYDVNSRHIRNPTEEDRCDTQLHDFARG